MVQSCYFMTIQYQWPIGNTKGIQQLSLDRDSIDELEKKQRTACELHVSIWMLFALQQLISIKLKDV